MAKVESKPVSEPIGMPREEPALANVGAAGDAKKAPPAASKRPSKTLPGTAPDVGPPAGEKAVGKGSGKSGSKPGAGVKDDRGPPPPLPTPMATFKL